MGVSASKKTSLIEHEDFPFEFLSKLGKCESWRKEVHRPIYHVHKWWAKRLGSVFRGILLGCTLTEGENLEQHFYTKSISPHIKIFDPFMGSGTTIGEAQKLGINALGRDINPVACEAVRVALCPINRKKLLSFFEILESRIGVQIKNLYSIENDQNHSGDVLYYFWVKQCQCPDCENTVDLFSSYLFAKHAYPKKHPRVQVYCPHCSNIFESVYSKEYTTCPHCSYHFNIRQGTVKGTKAQCTKCRRNFSVASAIRANKGAPKHKLYAKLILSENGEKVYLPATKSDLSAYHSCSLLLKKELQAGSIKLPQTKLLRGHNTQQALNYNYSKWQDFFNDRQLLALSWLHREIALLPNSNEKDALLVLFSGVLEFNNLFASYKGEGTGAVRHMFSHHILKPERMPVEAHLWGTPKSSGSFSGLFKSRLLRAIDYRDNPFEINIEDKTKIFGLSEPLGNREIDDWNSDIRTIQLSLSCGDSANTGLPSQCIDFVVTDPPFFDNVHYSELADFFFSWQKLYPYGFVHEEKESTRSEVEVQDTDCDNFAEKLRNVFTECYRVLKNDGLLVFTYHHSRPDGWLSLADAIYGAGFSIVEAHPVQSEMSVATPKSQAKEPILIDAILVCKKTSSDQRILRNSEAAIEEAVKVSERKLVRLSSTGIIPTKSDRFVICVAQFFAALGPLSCGSLAKKAFQEQEARLYELSSELAVLTSKESNRPLDIATQAINS